MPSRFRRAVLAGLVLGMFWVRVATARAGQTTTGLSSEMLDKTWNLVSLKPDGQAV